MILLVIILYVLSVLFALFDMISETPNSLILGVIVGLILKQYLVSKFSSHIYNVQYEGASTSTPSFFYDDDYVHWKDMIIIYLQSIDYDLWLSIKNRLYKPTKIENDIMIPKLRSEYTDNDKKLFFMDVKDMNTLYCSLSRSEFNRISSCKNANDIWHALEVTHYRYACTSIWVIQNAFKWIHN